MLHSFIPPYETNFCSLDASPALFALTISIDTYQYASNKLPNLTGCVADANAIVEYLTNQLRVPEDHIKSLRNSDATRANIIQSIVDLSENPDIKTGDAILIFYAGHGSEAAAPEGWPARGSEIQMLLPYDFSPTTSSEPERQGLHDITFGALLSRLAERKGNNIVGLCILILRVFGVTWFHVAQTVILDSCHSGSGARTFATGPSSLAFNVRRAELHQDYRILSSVDQELRQEIGGSRKANDVEPITSGLHSHVLLAGTSAKGYSMENTAKKRGVFTAALLDLLKRDSPDTISYKDAIGRLPDLLKYVMAVLRIAFVNLHTIVNILSARVTIKIALSSTAKLQKPPECSSVCSSKMAPSSLRQVKPRA